MLRPFLIAIALGVGVSTSLAQVANRPVSGFGLPVAAQTTTSLPLFLQPVPRQSTDFNRQLTKALTHDKVCPMPVYRPDTSRHDRSLMINLTRTLDPGMIVEVNCPNPLDSKVTPGPFARADSAPPPKAPGIF